MWLHDGRIWWPKILLHKFKQTDSHFDLELIVDFLFFSFLTIAYSKLSLFMWHTIEHFGHHFGQSMFNTPLRAPVPNVVKSSIKCDMWSHFIPFDFELFESRELMGHNSCKSPRCKKPVFGDFNEFRNVCVFRVVFWNVVMLTNKVTPFCDDDRILEFMVSQYHKKRCWPHANPIEPLFQFD